MPVNFDLNDIYAFRALMEYGSFRLAAESICLSQLALSRRIEKLERARAELLRLFEFAAQHGNERHNQAAATIMATCWLPDYQLV